MPGEWFPGDDKEFFESAYDAYLMLRGFRDINATDGVEGGTANVGKQVWCSRFISPADLELHHAAKAGTCGNHW